MDRSYEQMRGEESMTKDKFYEWLNTCPIYKYHWIDEEENFCRILFQINEDPEEGET